MALVSEVTKNHSDETPEVRCVDYRNSTRRTSVSVALCQSGLYGRAVRRKLLFRKTHMTLHFSKRHLKDFQAMRNKILLSDASPGQFHHYRDGNILLKGCFSSRLRGLSGLSTNFMENMLKSVQNNVRVASRQVYKSP